jgi:hypothetical protein
VAVGVQPLFQSTKEYCKQFLTHREPEFFVNMPEEDLAYEQILLDQEAVEQGLKFRKFPEPFLERSIIQRRVADDLVGRNILMLHGSTVAVDGFAYLFTAPCGTGKSTHTRLWREVFGERSIMVNDDKPFLQITAQGVYACGSPWSGKHGLDSNVTLPLGGICILERGTENRIVPMAAEDAMPMLLHQSYHPMDSAREAALASLLNRLTQQVPLWHMHCTKDPAAAQVAYAAMSSET